MINDNHREENAMNKKQISEVMTSFDMYLSIYAHEDLERRSKSDP